MKLLLNPRDSVSCESKLRDSAFAYRKLSSNTSMLSMGTNDDAIYQRFYNTTKDVNIGKFQQIKTLAKSKTQTDINAASSVNQSVNTKLLVEDNQKAVNTIYLKEKAHNLDTANAIRHRYKYDANELATLNNIAYQNPKKGGNAVYMARVMLGIIVFDNDVKEKSLRRKSIAPIPIAKQLSYQLFPNPNNGNMNLLYSMNKASKGDFYLYDITGSLIKKYTLQSGENNLFLINETELNNGVYLYKVVIDNEVKISDKLIIIK